MTIQRWRNSREAREKSSLIIIGGGGHGKVCAEIAYLMGKWDDIYLLDDQYIQETPYYKWLGYWSELPNYFLSSSEFFIAVGDQKLREVIALSIPKCYRRFATLIHPCAVISPEVVIKSGTVVMAGVVINNHVTIGKHVILNTGCSVDHECIVSSYAHISPGARLCGNVLIEESVWIGAGGVVLPNCTIYQDCIIGAASLVTKNISSPGVYIGVPCKKVKKLDP